MAQTVVSIMNPTAPVALAVVLGRRAFLREIAFAVLLSLLLPLILLVGVYLAPFFSNPIALAIGTISTAGIFAVPLIWYASFRLNAATLARERAVVGRLEQKIYPPWRAPFFPRRTFVAGSVRSLLLSQLPVTTAGILAFAVMAYVTGGNFFMPLVDVLLGVLLVVQIIVAGELLLTQQVPPDQALSDEL